MKRYLYTLLSILYSFTLHAQIDHCGADFNEDYAVNFQNSMPDFYNYLSKVAKDRQHTKSSNSNAINSIPLNINIVRDDWGNTVMDTSLIRKGIKYMNEKFAAAGMEFYVCGDYNYIDDSQYYNFGGNAYQTINSTYGIPDVINIYFVWFIVYNGGSAVGLAPTPGGGDWIIMRHNADTTVYAHEMGHFFGLLHTHGLKRDFFGYPYTEEYVDGSNCQETGDYFCDTPADPGLSPAVVNGANVNAQCQYFGNKKDGHNEVYIPDPGNLMGYGPHHCQDHFSPQQAAYMNWSYLTRRSNLSCAQLNVDFNYLNGLSCDSPYLFQFQNLSVGLSNLEWDMNDDGITDYTSLNPSHTFTTPGVKWISLKGTAGGKTYSRCKTIEIVAPNQVPHLEDFNNILLPEAWKIYNPDNGRQWGRTDVVGSDGLISNALYFDNFDYVGYEEEDIIITNAYDLTNFQNARLTFDIAYALHNKLDRFYVNISTDCGNTYSTQILNLVGANLQTHPLQYHKFIPTENDWKSVVISLDNYVGNFVSFQLVNYNEGGNVVYLDNVKVEGGYFVTQEIGWAKTSMSTMESSLDGQSSCKGYRIVSVPLFISEAPLANIDVQITSSGNATDILDYEILNPNLVFPLGEDSMQQVLVKIYDDAASETMETLNLHLSILGTSAFSTTTMNDLCAISIQDNDPFAAGSKVFSETLLEENFNVMNANEPPGWHSTYSDPYTNSYWISSSFYNFWLFNPASVQDKMSLDSTHYMLVANIHNYNTQRDSAYLLTYDLNVEDFDSLVLEMDHWYEAEPQASGDVVVDVWDGNAWVNLFQNTSLNGSFGGELAPLHSIFKLNSFSNSDFKIRFGIQGELYGNWYFLDNVKLTGYKTKGRIADSLGVSTTQYLGPNELVHFYENNTHELLGTIQNLSPWDYGCTTVSIDRAGVGVVPYLSLDSTYFASEKTILINPTNNNPTGNYLMTMYLNQEEGLAWVNGTGNNLSDMALVKTGGPISNISPSNPQANGATNFEGMGSVQQIYAINDIQVSGLFSTGFSGFATVKSGSFSLPVEFYQELGGDYIQDQGNLLTWTTVTEVNNDYFEVQHSLDGIHFEVLGQLNGMGNSTGIRKYEFLHKNFALTNNYYRLKQVDYNGEFSFSNIAIVSNGGDELAVQPKVYPNPSADFVNIEFKNRFEGEMLLQNVNGQLVIRRALDSFIEEINLSQLSKGLYYLQLININGKVYHEKIVKK